MHKFSSGATSTKKMPDFTLVPKAALVNVAERLGVGVPIHGRDNWKEGKDDPEYVRDRWNHFWNHALDIQEGKGKFEDLQAAICNLAMVCWFRENGTGFTQVFPNLVEPTVHPPNEKDTCCDR